jgi:GH24 family phage-related lysozyme (muramidase)
MNTIKITDELKARIRDHEGCRDEVYLDSLGKATIAIGHLVQTTNKEIVINQVLKSFSR